MAIMGIIAAAILGTASAAMEAGRRSRTRGMITRLNTLLMERWDSYANRKADVNPTILSQIDERYRSGTINAAQRGQMLADARLLALRELIKMEMPDRWSDIVSQGLADQANQTPSNFNYPRILASVPPVTQTYYRRLISMADDVDADQARSNQGAECLYMTILFHTGDGEARTLFSAQDIGDTDGDGAEEFLDGWGNPIQYIRWPAGFLSESTLMTGDAEADHDPFDVFRRDSPAVDPSQDANVPRPELYPPAMQPAIQEMRNRNRRVGTTQSPPEKVIAAFRLVPLIYSIGPDEDADLQVALLATTGLDPYADEYGNANNVQLGYPADQEDDGQGWQDNIHNHLNEY
jgi:hypothetical protein